MEDGIPLKKDINSRELKTENILGIMYTRKLLTRPRFRIFKKLGISPPPKYIVKNATPK
jgi:hypothetical protein